MENSTQESHLRSENSITYDSPYPLYATAFSSSTRSPHHHRIAVDSFVEEFNNRVDILSFDEETLSLKPNPNLSFEHPYPPTKLMFHPNPSASRKSSELLASSGDYLRLWEIRDNNSIEPLLALNNAKASEFCAPLTSFDWNEVEVRRIGTSSIDTTCTIWDIEKGVIETQLIAHYKKVYDIAWGEAEELRAKRKKQLKKDTASKIKSLVDEKYLVRDVVHVLRVTAKLRYYPKDYVQEFMAEAVAVAVAFLLRNTNIDQIEACGRRVMVEVAKKPLVVRKSGVSALLWYVMRGTSSKLHSRAEQVLRLLLHSSILGIGDKFAQG